MLLGARLRFSGVFFLFLFFSLMSDGVWVWGRLEFWNFIFAFGLGNGWMEDRYLVSHGMAASLLRFFAGLHEW